MLYLYSFTKIMLVAHETSGASSAIFVDFLLMMIDCAGNVFGLWWASWCWYFFFLSEFYLMLFSVIKYYPKIPRYYPYVIYDFIFPNISFLILEKMLNHIMLCFVLFCFKLSKQHFGVLPGKVLFTASYLLKKSAMTFLGYYSFLCEPVPL